MTGLSELRDCSPLESLSQVRPKVQTDQVTIED